MRNLLFLLLCLPLAVSAYGEEEPELIIEMNGTPSRSASSDVTVLQKSAAQLTKLFRGKTREALLAAADSMPTADQTLQSSDGKNYLFVQFGEENYRKCLFDAQKNNTLITCTDNLKDTLALQRQHKLPIPVSMQELTTHYGDRLRTQTISSSGKKQIIVQLLAKGEDGADGRFLYENGRLVKIFTTKQEMETHIQAQQKEAAAPKPAASKPAAPQRPVAKPKKSSAGVKALLSGGTLHDRMYMPRVISAPPGHMPSTQSNASSGSRSR